MKSKKRSENSAASVGSVNVLMDNGIIFQGQLRRNNERKSDDYPQINVTSRNEFIFLELRCLPSLLRDNATIKVIEPELYQIGDIIRINVGQIASVGPSGECLEEENGTGTTQA